MITKTETIDTIKRPPCNVRRRIGDVLFSRGLVTEGQLEAAMQRQRQSSQPRPIGQILVEMEAITSEQLTEVLAESFNIPFMVLVAKIIQRHALDCLPADFLEEHNLLPISIIGNCLTVAVDRFSDLGLIDDIRRVSGKEVQVIAAEASNIRQTRKEVIGSHRSEASSVGEETMLQIDEIVGDPQGEQIHIAVAQDEVEAIPDGIATIDSPIIKLVNGIIQNAVEAGASDIHIEPDPPTFRVRYRVDGDLSEPVRLSSKLLPAVVSRIKILAGLDIAERRLPQDGGITIRLADRSIELRTSTMTTKFGEKVVMRVVDRQAKLRGLDTLGLGESTLKQFRNVIRDAHGVVIITGPTGSGKTSTLYSALAEISSVRHNVSTIEDPVERRLPGTNQFQVNGKAGFTFSSALRSMLRQDPDVIMVGEIRDPETAKLATEAALTGHLVLTTLHTNDALTAVPRLVNMGVEPYLVAASLRAVLAQRLVRRLCQHCCKPEPLNQEKADLLGQVCNDSSTIEKDYVATGCPRCRHTGYSGRVGIFELLLLNEELLSVVTRGVNISALREITARQGHTTLVNDALIKLRNGVINVDSLLEIVSRADMVEDSKQIQTTLKREVA